MIKSILRISGALFLLGATALVAAWFYLDEEHTLLDAGVRAQFNETFIELPNGVVHYEFGGPVGGELVVLVHGFSVPAYIWDPTFESLTSAGYRVLRFDLYGRGHSDRPDVAYTIPFFADQLDQLTRLLNVDTPFNLLGLSMGGPITTQFTNQHTGKVKRLVLIDPMVFAPSEEDISPLSLPVIDDAGHIPHFELPDVFNPLLLEYLRTPLNP